MLSNVISQLWQNLLKLLQKLKHHCPQKVRDKCLNVFHNLIYYSGRCYEMLLCCLLTRGCLGGIEQAAAIQVRHSWLHLLVRVVVQVYDFLLFSVSAQTSWEAIKGVLCRLKVDPEKDIMNMSVDSFSS